MPDSNRPPIWYTRCPVPSPLGLAARLGWLDESFGRQGLEVRSLRDDPDPHIRESHFNHHLRWSFRQGGNIPALWARSRWAAGHGPATRLVALTWTDEFQALISLPGRGPASLAALAGVRLGVPRNDSTRVDFQRATSLKGLASGLSLAGLTLADVRLVELPAATGADSAGSLFGLPRRQPYAREAAALQRGEIDAFFVKGAEGVQAANALGAVALADFSRHPDPRVRINNGTPRTLTVDDTLVQERPDLVQLLLAQVQRASHWALSHPDETLRFVAREIQVSEEAVLASNGADVHRHLGLSLDPALLDALAHFKRFLLDHGFLPTDFDLDDWVEPTALAAVQALPQAA